MAKVNTKEHLLDCAEELFGERSFASVSVREIAKAAGANMAAVNYHFGSKDALLVAVFERKARLLNNERIGLLTEAVEKSGDQPVPLRDILFALIAPSVRWNLSSERGFAPFLQFLQRCRSEGSDEMQRLMDKYANFLQRFIPHLSAALPHLDEEEIYWRFFFGLGVMSYTYTDYLAMERLSNGSLKFTDPDVATRRAVSFAEAVFMTP